MRVIAGTARSLRLETVEGMDTRPTTDRIKETLFNILSPGLPDCTFLDLFAGSGAIGIEALSRGASSAVFVESHKRACMCIRKNLSFTKLADHGKILNMDVMQALVFLEGKGRFDFVFADPPYGKGYPEKILSYLKDSAVVDEDTLIVIEERLDTDISFAEEMGFTIRRVKAYKTNKHIFLSLTQRHR
ncbi:MAG: 16S rRNA (guanine(966)-N(2))-methyltransferase RsmD [Blautia sp.]|nr:16S rRNA (guanine(966)-N(2))-methyltransferase RsmD [Blautia sp.]